MCAQLVELGSLSWSFANSLHPFFYAADKLIQVRGCLSQSVCVVYAHIWTCWTSDCLSPPCVDLHACVCVLARCACAVLSCVVACVRACVPLCATRSSSFSQSKDHPDKPAINVKNCQDKVPLPWHNRRHFYQISAPGMLSLSASYISLLPSCHLRE